jgi:hypothetical protein
MKITFQKITKGEFVTGLIGFIGFVAVAYGPLTPYQMAGVGLILLSDILEIKYT